MSRPSRDSNSQAVDFRGSGSRALGSSDLEDPPESQWVRSQLPLLNKILDQLDREDLTPRQRVRALRNLKRPLLEMVKALSRLETLESDPKVSTLEPSPTSAQRLIERMCRNLEHLLLALDRRRFHSSLRDDADRRWTLRQLFVFLGRQIELGVLGGRPWPPRTWQRLHDLFEYLIERQGLRLDAGGSALGRGFDPETAYKRLLILGLCHPCRGVRRLGEDIQNQLTRWAIESRLVEPAGRLGEYGLIVVETSLDAPPRFREQPANDPWRGWVLEPPGELLDFVGLRRPSLTLADPQDGNWLLRGRRR